MDNLCRFRDDFFLGGVNFRTRFDFDKVIFTAIGRWNTIFDSKQMWFSELITWQVQDRPSGFSETRCEWNNQREATDVLPHRWVRIPCPTLQTWP